MLCHHLTNGVQSTTESQHALEVTELGTGHTNHDASQFWGFLNPRAISLSNKIKSIG